MRNKRNLCRYGIIIILVMGIFFYWQNNGITISKITFESNKIPRNFEGFKIVHISDLHNKEFGENQYKLMDKIKKANPNLIVFTGDLIDHSKSEKGDESFIREIKNIAPVFYVSGNHEAWSGNYEMLRDNLKEAGITVLDNQRTKIERNGEYIDIIGIQDSAFFSKDNTKLFEGELNKLVKQEENNNFKILLSHRPELIDLYVSNNLDLVFSGHAHGGQFRIPLVGGVLAPNRSLFPKYTSGMHTINNTSMIISRGLGNSIIPVRIFNRPEVIDITLKVK